MDPQPAPSGVKGVNPSGLRQFVGQCVPKVRVCWRHSSASGGPVRTPLKHPSLSGPQCLSFPVPGHEQVDGGPARSAEKLAQTHFGILAESLTSLNFSFLLYEMIIMCFLLNCYKDPMDPSSEPGTLGLLDHYHHHGVAISEAANSAS